MRDLRWDDKYKMGNVKWEVLYGLQNMEYGGRDAGFGISEMSKMRCEMSDGRLSMECGIWNMGDGMRVRNDEKRKMSNGLEKFRKKIKYYVDCGM